LTIVNAMLIQCCRLESYPKAAEAKMISLFCADSTIKRDVEDEIKWDLSIGDSSHIAVAVKDGVVILPGSTKNYMVSCSRG